MVAYNTRQGDVSQMPMDMSDTTVQEALRPIEEEMSAMRAEIDSLVDRCAPIPPHLRPCAALLPVLPEKMGACVLSVAEVSAAAQAERGV